MGFSKWNWQRISRHAATVVCAALVALFPGVSAASRFAYYAAYDFATSGAATLWGQTNQCNSPTCTYLPESGFGTGQVNSSDWSVGQAIEFDQLSDGEVISWVWTAADGSTYLKYSLTYNASTNCFLDSNNQLWCYGTQYEYGWNEWAIINSCKEPPGTHMIGSWKINTYDNGAPLYENDFTISRNPSSVLGITSPTDNQLFQLTSGNYNGTGTVQFSGGGTGSSPNWSVQLHYLTSGGKGGPDPSPLTFPGLSYSYPGYQSIGGQVVATASATATDNSTVQDCVTFYVEGPETGNGGQGAPGGPTGGQGILNTIITSRLDMLYQQSPSYPNDGTATPDLMTGIAMKESSYKQFLTPEEPPYNPDLFSLWNNFTIAAKWPLEGQKNGQSDGGTHIGLMMFPTSDGDAWDWTINTNDGVNDSTYGFAGNDLPLANTLATWMIKGNSKSNFPGHSPLAAPTGYQLENLALVLYGPYAHSTLWAEQYYIPVCIGTLSAKNNTWTCSGAKWYWAINDPSIDPNVQTKNIFPPGTTVLTFGNSDGIDYVNNPNDPNSPGVRDLLQ